MATENIFREVASKADIVKVVSYFLGAQAVRRKGNVYYAVCPFHDDHHPSMRIDPKLNIFKCFSCGEGGDAITFVERYAHIEKMEALKKVAEICDIPLDLDGYRTNKDALAVNYPDEIKALRQLDEFYQLVYKSSDGKAGVDYLKERGISEETRAHFEIGYAPSDPKQAVKSLREHGGFSVSTLERAGIIANGGELEDRYRERLMFPIKDDHGRVVGFSGRQIRPDQTGGKYINYPETPLFVKSRILYHLDKAKESMKRDGYLYLCEGFMDVIAFQRAGINSVAGLMGTALTDDHLRLIKKEGVQIRLALDFDEAGQNGEEKAIKLLVEHDIPVRLVRPSRKGKDPDEIFSHEGKEVFLSIYTKRLLDPVLFLLARALKGMKKLTDPAAINMFLTKASIHYQRLSDVERLKDAEVIASVTDMTTDIVRSALEKSSRNQIRDGGEDESFKTSKRYQPRDSLSERRYTDFVLGGRYSNPADFDSYLDSLKDASDEIIDHSILKNEAQILFAELKDRKAFHLVSAERITLLYFPFYVLNVFITDFYLSKPDALTFEIPDLQALSSRVRDQDDMNTDEGDDAIDLSDGVDDFTLTETQKSYLQGLISIAEKTISNDYDENGLKKIVKSEQVYAKIVSLRRKRLEEDSDERDIDEKIRLLRRQLVKIKNS